jgi:hypothetical protein
VSGLSGLGSLGQFYLLQQESKEKLFDQEMGKVMEYSESAKIFEHN